MSCCLPVGFANSGGLRARSLSSLGHTLSTQSALRTNLGAWTFCASLVPLCVCAQEGRVRAWTKTREGRDWVRCDLT